MFLSSFYTWAGRELNLPNPLKGVPAPKFERAPVESFAKEEIEALPKAVGRPVDNTPLKHSRQWSAIEAARSRQRLRQTAQDVCQRRGANGLCLQR